MSLRGRFSVYKKTLASVVTSTLTFSLLPTIFVGTSIVNAPIASATTYSTIALETATVTSALSNSGLQFVELGSLASRSQSTVAVKKSITRSSTSPYTVTGTDSLSGQSYQYQTLQAYSGNNLYESMDVTSTIVAAANSSPTYGLNSKSMSFDSNASYGTRSGVNQLTSSMASIPRTSGQAPYGSVFGPQIWSVPFEGGTGQSISFDWAAANGQDDYEIYAFLVRLDTTTNGGVCNNSVNDYGLTNPTTTHTLMAYGRGTTQSWITASAPITSAGCYRFRFVHGTYDQTGGLAVGASLYVDNTVIVGQTQTITFPAISDLLRDTGNAQTVNAGATSNAAGAVLDYSSSTTSVCTVNSLTGVITIAAGNTGTCTITVNSGAVGNYAAASPVTRSFSIVSAATVPSSQNSSYISGTAGTCEVLTIVEGAWNTGGSSITGTSYQWQSSANGSSWTDISGATNGTYTTLSTDYNSYIRAQIRKTNAIGTSNPENTSSLLISTQTNGCSTVASTTSVTQPSSLLTFATNGADNNSFPQSEIKGTTVKLWKNVLTRAGYTFTGWNTKADGTGTSYADQASFNFNADFITLYAQWSLIQSTPIITWANPAYITTATPLSATQLNATASVPGTCTYTPSLGATLPAGKQTLTCLFTPTDTTKYSTISKSVEIEVLAIPTLTWANPASIKSGTALSATQLNATASAAGSFSYQPSLGAVLKPGKQTLKVTFTPTDTRLSPIIKEVTIEITPALNPAAEAITTVSGGSKAGAITQTTTDATVVIKTLGVGLEKATATANQLTVFAKGDYSGKTTVVITVNDEARSVDLTVPVTVNPAAVAQGSFTITSASSSTATWQAASGAKSYRLSLDGKEICTSSTTSCQIPALTGPASKVIVKSLGADDTSSADKALAYEKPATPIEITSVNFATAKSTLTKSARNKLNAFASQVSALGLSTLVIQGHTDSVGGIDNQALSNARAQAAARYLRSKLANVNITVKGFGPNDPIADNSSDEGRAQNRRAGVYIGG